MRTYWTVSLPCYQKGGSARRLLHGVVILEWTRYVSWSLSSEGLMLGTIWEKYEEVCKPQLNEVRARFDLLTSFWPRKQVSWWMVQCSTDPGYFGWVPPQKKPRYFTWTSHGFSSKMKSLSQRQSTIVIKVWTRFPPSQGQAACKEDRELKGDCQAHSRRWQVTSRWLRSILMGHEHTYSPIMQAQEEEVLC